MQSQRLRNRTMLGSVNGDLVGESIGGAFTVFGGIVGFFRWHDAKVIRKDRDRQRNNTIDKVLEVVQHNGGVTSNILTAVKQNGGNTNNLGDIAYRTEKALTEHLGWANATVHDLNARIATIENQRGRTHYVDKPASPVNDPDSNGDS